MNERQKVSTESPDCGCDIVFDCLNGWRCCKVNYWVFVMTVFAVYSLIVLIVPCLLGDMRGEHNISGSRKVIQSHTTRLHFVWEEDEKDWLAYYQIHSWETGKCRNAGWCMRCNPERSQFAVKGLVSAPVSRERGAWWSQLHPGDLQTPVSSLCAVCCVTKRRCNQWKLKT